jgi:hypothetical protein
MFKLILLSIVLSLLLSCKNPETTKLLMDGKNNPNLPEELKGLKVYKVYLNSGNPIKVAVLNGQIKSVSETSGKVLRQTMVLTKEESKDCVYMIPIQDILLENDTIITARKKIKYNY